MPKKKPIDQIEQSAPDVPPMPQRGREVVYTIVVPNCDDRVKIGHARRTLIARHIPERKIRVEGGNVVSVPRFVTIWQGDEAEQAWQRSIQNAIPGALIDVQDWTPAPGYPQGEIGEKNSE